MRQARVRRLSSSLRRIRQEYKRTVVDSVIPGEGTPGVVVRKLERTHVVPRDRLERCREGCLLRRRSLEAATVSPFLVAPRLGSPFLCLRPFLLPKEKQDGRERTKRVVR